MHEKQFSNTKCCRDHPNVEGLLLFFGFLSYFCTLQPSTLGWSLQYLLFENCFSCVWDLSNSWGYKGISSIWKHFGGTPWIPSWNIIFYLKSVFQYSSNMYLKSGLNHHPQSKKQKNPGFLNSFSPTPPPKAGVQKYLRPGPTSGGTFALPLQAVDGPERLFQQRWSN